MKRGFVVLLVVGCVLFLVAKRLGFQQDIATSLESGDRLKTKVFSFYKDAAYFNNRIYVDSSSLDVHQQAALDKALLAAGYAPVGPSQEAAKALYQLTPFLPLATLNQLVSQEVLENVTLNLKQWLLLPGSAPLIRDALEDPFAVKAAVTANLLAGKSATPSSILSFERLAALDYEKAGEVYKILKQQNVPFIGADFFAFENFQAVKADIRFCVLLSSALGLAAFFWICRSWVLLFFLFFGTWVSYVLGLGLVSCFYSQVYAVVLAFTTTFLGYNNEYLVHFSGIPRERRLAAALGLGSAIGTTLIGFLILLFSASEIVRQMALVSLGGMVGFIGLMLLYQDKLAKVRFRVFYFPKWHIKPVVLLGMFGTALAAMFLLPSPGFFTEIDSFRYESPVMKANQEFFDRKLNRLAPGGMQAVKVDGSVEETFKRVTSKGFHPLQLFKSQTEQEKVIGELASVMTNMTPTVRQAFNQVGLQVPEHLSPWIASLKPLSPQEYLALWRSVTGMPWGAEVEGQYFIFTAGGEVDEAIALHPRRFYNEILTETQTQAVTLFLIGFALMVAYLLPLQRQWRRVLYIVCPLFCGVALTYTVLVLRNQPVNFIHIVGLALVIALALDYTAIAISSAHAGADEAKIFLTGFINIIMFGVLAFASHPVLRDLGLVVSLGSSVALLFALFVRLKGEEA